MTSESCVSEINVPYIPLRVHSEYSLEDSMIRVGHLIDKAVELGLPAVALTDCMNLFAMVKFYQKALAKGIQPIIGADVRLVLPEHYKPATKKADQRLPKSLQRVESWPTVTLLCQNQAGFKNLMQLLGDAYHARLETQRVAIELADLERHSEGLIILMGGSAGPLAPISELDHIKDATWVDQWFEFLNQHFNTRYYLEISRYGHPKERQLNHAMLNLAAEKNAPVVATNLAVFLASDDFMAHEARVCIHDGDTLDNPHRAQKYFKAQYLKSPEEMQTLFEDCQGALINTVQIAKRCAVALHLDEYFLPQFPIPEGSTDASYLTDLSEQGLEKRLAFLFPDPSVRSEKQPSYAERLQVELDVINQMGFPGYFLIVADFIQWAKNNDVPVGPGRGSGAGSLVAYALGITDLDPLAYDLLFERFLNPERVSMPDFDVDFCMDGRDRVIDYVAQKYGRNAVSQIITYGSMAAKAVIRDVGRVLGKPYGFVDKLAKLIPLEIGITLQKAFDAEEALQAAYQNDEEVREVWDLAIKLEGITRNAGKHAGGVVIAPSQITDFTPIYTDGDSAGTVTQLDKDDVEKVGLVKFDFLGLRTLTIIDWAVKAINELAESDADKVNIEHIPTDDPTTFELLKRAETTAVFQLESRGMKELIKRLEPGCFEEIVALVALFRPGPLQSGMVDDFINRKHGRQQVVYPHPELEPILQTTYGVILYQEQVMQIAQVLAGYTLGGADLLRRAMGKKKPEEMAKQRTIFLEGSGKREIDQTLAGQIFDLMEKFAGYGFNKSHSAAYALVSYQTAWLKAHYPAAFMAAVLSSDMDNTEKVVLFIEECRLQKIPLKPPHVNYSEYRFKVTKTGEILYGLGAIKGVGEAVIQQIVEERQASGPYQDLFDFCRRIDLKKANRRTLEALARAGALDDLGPNRQSILDTLPRATHLADQREKESAKGQASLFSELVEVVEEDCQFAPTGPAEFEAVLNDERATLGLFLSGHPVDPYRDELKKLRCVPLKQALTQKLPPKKGKTVITVGGYIEGLRIMRTKKGDKMAVVTLDDGSDRMDIVAYSRAFEAHEALLVKDSFVVIEGGLSFDQFSESNRLTVDSIRTLNEAREQGLKTIELQLEPRHFESHASPQIMLDDMLSEVTAGHEGACDLRFSYQTTSLKVRFDPAKPLKLAPTKDNIKKLQSRFGVEKVRLIYS